jgi:NAD dependent epimerase/dehydratase
LNWNGRTVLVTGAGGFIGSHVADRLVELGASVRALVHYNALDSWGWLDSSPRSKDMQVIVGDITDHLSIRQALRGADYVFHLAALIAIPYSYSAPGSYIRTNIEGTMNVLETARDFGVVRVLHTSTSEVYGSACYVPIDEAHPLQAQSPYSATKIGADKLAESFHLSFQLPVVTVRPFNTFGPRQSARAVVPTIITQCLTGEAVRLGNLCPTRDLNYVSNTVDGFIAAAETPGAEGQTFNIGSGREITIEDLAQLIGRLVGCDVRVQIESRRIRPEKSEVGRLLASNEKARAVLGWSPAVHLEEGLERTITWMRSHLDRYRRGVYVI